MKYIQRSMMFFIVLFALSACSTHEPMMPQEMYSAPDFSEKMPEYITAISLTLDQSLDVSDTAFYPDAGIGSSTTWPFYLVAPGEDMKSARRLAAVRVKIKNQIRLLVFIPEKLSAIKDHLGFLTDHAGKRIFSHTGQRAYVPDWQSIDPSKFGDIIKPIREMRIIEGEKGSTIYENFIYLLKPFKYQSERAWAEAIKLRNDYYRAYDIPINSFLTEDQMNRVMKDDSFKARLISLLGDNWYGVFTLPFWTPAEYGASMLLAKVFQIPTKFWSYDFNKAGYMERAMNGVQTEAMIRYHAEHYVRELVRQELEKRK